MATCRSCSAPIFWAVTDPGGKPIPIDADPSPRGNAEVLVGRRVGDSPVVRIHGQAPMLADGPLHLPHFATCPNAAEHRKRGHGG